jgi:hypothetical protein
VELAGSAVTEEDVCCDVGAANEYGRETGSFGTGHGVEEFSGKLSTKLRSGQASAAVHGKVMFCEKRDDARSAEGR